MGMLLGLNVGSPLKPKHVSGVSRTVSFEKRIPLLKIQIENHSFSNIYFKDEMRSRRLQYLLYKHLSSRGFSFDSKGKS